jgi:hypothetical protein
LIHSIFFSYFRTIYYLEVIILSVSFIRQLPTFYWPTELANWLHLPVLIEDIYHWQKSFKFYFLLFLKNVKSFIVVRLLWSYCGAFMYFYWPSIFVSRPLRHLNKIEKTILLVRQWDLIYVINYYNKLWQKAKLFWKQNPRFVNSTFKHLSSDNVSKKWEHFERF